MKNLLLISIISLFLLACNKNDEVELEDFELGTEEQFKLGAINKSADNLLKFRITEINDSRCPSDVTCVWEGMVEVKISIENPITDSIALNSHNNLIDTVGQYIFELKEITPYPVSTKTIELEDYDVTLKIFELD